MFALSLFFACTSGNEEAEAEAEEEVLETMDRHWDEAEAMREAVVAGDVNRVHELAKSFQKRMPIQGLPADLAPLATGLAEQITAAEQSADAKEAGMAVGRMAAACGTCHTSAKVVPTLDSKLRPSKNKDAPPEMVMHQVVEAKMWAAIVRHDDASFQEAVTQLGKAKFHIDDGSEPGREFQEMEQRIQQGASQAATEPGLLSRGEALGHLLGTCAECHEKVGLKL